MRRILILTRLGFSASRAAIRRASFAACTASLAVTFCFCSDALAQSPAGNLIPTATAAFSDTPVSEGSSNQFKSMPTVNAGYIPELDRTKNEPASYMGGTGMQQMGSYPYSGDVCNAGCDVSYYVNYEALWLKRDGDERFSLSRNSFMDDYDYEFGGRYTIGNLLDCVNGWEATYVGPFDWERSSVVNGNDNLQSNFSTVGLPASVISGFNDADVHRQASRAQLNSFEINRRWWTWDVVSTMIGVRYVDYEEGYAFLSNTNGALTGEFRESIDNQMIGAQVGGDILYPVSLRSNVGLRLKGGVYANFNERETLLVNNGVLALNNGEEDTEVAGIIEGGIFTNYHIVPSIRLTAGYEFWYMPGVATVPEQSPAILTPSSGTSISTEADLFLHGGFVGAQVLF